MIYSCLVDADFLDTEYFMKNGLVERQSGQSMNILLKKLENRILDWLKNNDIDTVNVLNEKSGFESVFISNGSV